MLFRKFLSITLLGFLYLQGSAAFSAPVRLVSMKIEPMLLSRDCELVREEEPKYDVIVKTRTHDGVRYMTFPIYGDLCNMPTREYMSRIYYLSAASRDASFVIGVTGSSQDLEGMSFPRFSEYALKP